MNKPINFELSVLLKAKGYNEPTKLCYNGINSLPFPFNAGNSLYTNDLEYEAAPTILEVLDWLFIKHNIFIGIDTVIIGSD